MKKVLFLTIIVLFMINIDVVKAEVCDSNDMARVRGLAENVNYSYKYIGDEDDYQLYEVTFVGLSGNNLYVTDSTRKKKALSDSEKMLIDSGNHLLDIMYTPCNLRVKSLKIELPVFNEYSLENYCSSSEFDDFEYCDEWYSGRINDEIFERAAEKYLEEKNAKETNNNNELLEFLLKHKLVVGVVSVILIVLIVLLIIKKKADNELV
ncbi:MAG: hypothetical protein VZS44_06160 [Bacilli bacterium]|nr:hypothetical protein [Bacilli bacterium]